MRGAVIGTLVCLSLALCALAGWMMTTAGAGRTAADRPQLGSSSRPRGPEARAARPRGGEPRSFRVIAHRGGAGLAPENTLEAIEVALALGVTEVELDLQLSLDGEPVCFHDPSLQEKTGTSGRVRDYRAAELRELEIGTWFDRSHPDAHRRFAGSRLATLEQVFRQYRDRVFYHLELKSAEPELASRVIELALAHGLERDFMITSFHLERLEDIRTGHPDLALGYLVGRTSWLRSGGRAIEQALERDLDQIAFAASDLTADLVAAAHAHGLEIRAWGVRSEADMRWVLDVGADGMTVDRPDLLLKELSQSGAHRGKAPAH